MCTTINRFENIFHYESFQAYCKCRYYEQKRDKILKTKVLYKATQQKLYSLVIICLAKNKPINARTALMLSFKIPVFQYNLYFSFITMILNSYTAHNPYNINQYNGWKEQGQKLEVR